MVGGILLVSVKVFGLLPLSFILGGSKSLGEIYFSFLGFFPFLHSYFYFMDLKLTPSSTSIFFIYP